jgi:hypothetical protein
LFFLIEIDDAELDMIEEFKKFDRFLSLNFDASSDSDWGVDWQKRFEKVMDKQANEVDQESIAMQSFLQTEAVRFQIFLFARYTDNSKTKT